MDETTIGVAAILAPIIPLVVSVLKRVSLPAAFNMALAVMASLALATLGLVIAGQVDLQNGIQEPEAFLAAAGLAFAESQWIYRLLIKQTVTGERLNNVLTTWPARPKEARPLAETLEELHAEMGRLQPDEPPTEELSDLSGNTTPDSPDDVADPPTEEREAAGLDDDSAGSSLTSAPVPPPRHVPPRRSPGDPRGG